MGEEKHPTDTFHFFHPISSSIIGKKTRDRPPCLRPPGDPCFQLRFYVPRRDTAERHCFRRKNSSG